MLASMVPAAVHEQVVKQAVAAAEAQRHAQAAHAAEVRYGRCVCVRHWGVAGGKRATHSSCCFGGVAAHTAAS